MIYCFDLDGTLCTLEVDHMDEGPDKDVTQYTEATPKQNRIDYVNRLYDEGHTIIIETARGTVSGIDWYTPTVEQLKLWGFEISYITNRRKDFGRPVCG